MKSSQGLKSIQEWVREFATPGNVFEELRMAALVVAVRKEFRESGTTVSRPFEARGQGVKELVR